MKVFCTFGCGQPLEGKCLPLIADNEIQARQYMHKYFGSQWAFCYTEKEWEDAKNRIREFGGFPETEMHPIDIRGGDYAQG